MLSDNPCTVNDGDPPGSPATDLEGLRNAEDGTGSDLDPADAPPHRLSVLVGHHSVELPLAPIKDERKEMMISWPHRKIEKPRHSYPFESSLGIRLSEDAAGPIDPEHEPEPVLTLRTEAWPIDGSFQNQLLALETGLLEDLSPHTADHILLGIELSSQTIELAEMKILRSPISVDHQHIGSGFREDVSEGRKDGGVDHSKNRSAGHPIRQTTDPQTR